MILIDEVKDFVTEVVSRVRFWMSGDPKKRIKVLQLALLLVALPVGIFVFNQRWHFLGKASSATAIVQGYVYQQAGQVLSEVRVETVVDGKSVVANTNSSGFYKLSLQTGNYAIKFSKSGYKTTTRILTVTSGQTIVQDWTLIHE